MTDPTADEKAAADATTVKLVYDKLLSKVKDREKDLKTLWVEKAEQTWKIYSGEACDETPFNILYSNTEIIVPAVFSQKPIPDVRRRFDREKGDVPAQAMQNMLVFALDQNLSNFPNFMTVLEDSVLDAALPGQGQIRVRLVGDMPCLDYVNWKKYIWGYCERWEDKPWEAFRYDLTPADILREWTDLSEEQRKEIEASGKEDDGDKDKVTKETKPTTLAVYEVWDKATKKVTFLCDDIKNCLLEEVDDPLQLAGFFPTPRKPLNFVHSTTSTLPLPLYRLYKQQAEELNEVTRRIKKITQAIKIRGIYLGTLPDLAKIFEDGEENVLHPSEAASQVLSLDKGLESYIWLTPIDKFITVLQTLFTARDQIKSSIYEILGIGDILRGVSKASETLGAQEIKDKWGSLRINKTRERTSDFIRDGLRLIAEVAAKHTPPDVWAQVTGIPLKQPVETASLAADGQPPAPGESWEDVLRILQNDLTRAYTIDIELNSTVDPEATTEKEEAAAFMNALGTTMQALAPMAQASPEGYEAMKLILSTVAGKFRLGVNIEDKIRALPVPKALTGPPPEMQKLQADLQKQKQDLDQRAADLAKDEQVTRENQMLAQRTADKLQKQQDQIAADRQEVIRTQSQALADIQAAAKDVTLQKKELELVRRDIEMARKELALQGKENVVNIKMAKQPAKPATGDK